MPRRECSPSSSAARPSCASVRHAGPRPTRNPASVRSGGRAMPKLQGAHVLVTGGSSGIGLAAAHLALERDARVSLIARRADVLDEAAATLRRAGGKVAVA